jgi:hypothetical protein
LGSSIFTSYCSAICWNGFIWVAGGTGTNTLAYSYDGINWQGLGTTFITGICYDIIWTNTIFVAVGSGTNPVAYSYDGINWTTPTITVFTTVYSIAWNGFYMIATGAGTNRLASSKDGINWQGLGQTSMFSLCACIVWTGGVWIAGGTNSSAGVLATSYNNGQTWTTVSCPITNTVWSLETNGQRVIATGSVTIAGTGNTIAYSSDIYGTSWTGLGTSVFNTTTSTLQFAKWAVNKFVAFSNDLSGNRIAYSYDGITWNPATTANSIFSSAAFVGECATTQPHTIIFPTNQLVTGNLVSFNNGTSWQQTQPTLQNSSTVGFNGQQYIYGTIPPTLVNDLCGTLIPLTQFGSDPSQINSIKWNGSQWLIGGTSATTNHLSMSYDGFNWQRMGAGFFSAGYPCNGITWSGTAWVTSAITASGTNMMYSADGVNWSQTSTTAGGGPVEWNGSYYLAGSPSSSGNTFISISQNGTQWTTPTQIGINGNIQSIVWSGTAWVISTLAANSTVPGIMVSYNASSWSPVGGGQTFSIRGVEWSGLTFVANTSTNTIRYSYDGTNWSNTTIGTQSGNVIAWSKPHIGTMNIQQPTIMGGQGAYNTMAYSPDGIYFIGQGNNVFSQSCNHIGWNGQLWLAAGQGSQNTLAYSYDGQTWTGLGTGVFSQSASRVIWNGTVWLALGSGGNNMATSADGKSWTGLGNPIFDISANSADWNGQAWVAGGKGTVNTLAYSTQANASAWTGLGNTVLTNGCNTVKWMGNVWSIGGPITQGGNVFAYSTNSIGQSGWTYSPIASQIMGASVNSIYWNGQVAITAGTCIANTIATSQDGINWTGRGNQTFTTAAYDVIWNTKRWIAAGQGGNTAAYSYNGSTWYPAINTNGIFTIGQTVGTNSKVGVAVVPSTIYMTTNDKLAVNTPKWYDDALMSDTAININMNLLT